MTHMQYQWLSAVPWESVLTLNHALCQAKQLNSEHNGKTFDAARQLWERAVPSEMTLQEALDLCRQCSGLSPFVFNNGNTFAAICRTLLEETLKTMPPVEAQIIRTTAAHYVNGLVGKKELTQVLKHFESAWLKARELDGPVSSGDTPRQAAN